MGSVTLVESHSGATGPILVQSSMAAWQVKGTPPQFPMREEKSKPWFIQKGVPFSKGRFNPFGVGCVWSKTSLLVRRID